MSKNTIPPKGSSQWKKNEKMIASNPVLRAARDTAEGFKASSGISSLIIHLNTKKTLTK